MIGEASGSWNWDGEKSCEGKGGINCFSADSLLVLRSKRSARLYIAAYALSRRGCQLVILNENPQLAELGGD